MTASGPTWRDVVARWPLALGVFLIAIAASATVALVSPRAYDSSVRLYVYASIMLETPTIGQVVKANQFAVSSAEFAPTVMTSDANLDAVITELSLPWTRAELTEAISAMTVADSSIVTVTVTDASPQDAEVIVESVARAYIRSLSAQDETTDGETDVPLSITASQLEPASTAAKPSEPNLPLIFAVGGILGLLLGAIAAYAVASAARRASSLEQLSVEAGAPIMATLQHIEPENAEQSAQAQQVRLHWLAVRLGGLARARSARSFALTSTRTDEDVRELADHLVTTLTGDGASVRVVDLISRPASRSYSWSRATDGQSEPPEVALPLSADAMLALRNSLESSHDLVLWLVDPAAASADAVIAIAGVDETLLVTDRRASVAEVREARAAIGFAEKSFAGVIVTSVKRAGELTWSPFLSGETATSSSTPANR